MSWNQLLILRSSEWFEAICNGLYDILKHFQPPAAVFADGIEKTNYVLEFCILSLDLLVTLCPLGFVLVKRKV